MSALRRVLRKVDWLGVTVATAWWVAFLLIASRASASSPWSGSLQWRGERIELQSRCGPMDTAAVLKELEAGLARVQADVPGVTIPPLGAPWSPYIVLWTDAPKCPGSAIGCTGDAPFLKLPWTMARLDCRRGGLAALDHEAMEHTVCRRLRPVLRPGNPRLDVKRCTRAGHKLCAGKRCTVLGERSASK